MANWLIRFSLFQARQEDIAKIKEFTSITDHGRIEKAIDDCTNDQGVYDLSDVIEKLMENVGPFPSNQPASISFVYKSAQCFTKFLASCSFKECCCYKFLHIS